MNGEGINGLPAPVPTISQAQADLQLLKEATDFMKYQIDVQSQLRHLFLYLGARQIIENEDGSYSIIKIEGLQPKLNDEGFYSLMNILFSFVNHNNILSKYRDDETRDRLYHFLNDVAVLLLRNQKNWAPASMGILPVRVMDEIMVLIENLATATIFRARDGEDRDTIRKAGSYIEQNVKTEEVGKEKKFLGII